MKNGKFARIVVAVAAVAGAVPLFGGTNVWSVLNGGLTVITN